MRAGGGGGLAARAGGGGRACARLGVSCGRLQQQRSSSRSSSRGGGGLKKAPVAAWESAMRRAQLGSRWSRPEASQGRVARLCGRSFTVATFLFRKSLHVTVNLLALYYAVPLECSACVFSSLWCVNLVSPKIAADWVSRVYL